MQAILVPYHIHDHLPDLDVPVDVGITVEPPLPDGDPWTRMTALHERVAAAVADTIEDGDVPVVISGDCTTSLGTVAGLQRAGVDPAIVWLDAHGDVQTLETTASGYLGGLPLRLLVGYRPELIADALGLRAVAEADVVLVDARDLDPPEVDYLGQAPIRRCLVTEVVAADLPDRPLYLHVDADVVDAAQLPGLRYPAPSGPGLDDVGAAVRRVVRDHEVAAIGIGCTWHPGHGAGERFRGVLGALLDA